MLRFTILAICFTAILCAKSVVIAPTASMDGQSLQDRVDYFKRINLYHYCPYNNNTDTYVMTVRQTAPDLTRLKSVNAAWYVVTPTGALVDPPTLATSTTGGYLYITATFTPAQLTAMNGCIDLPTNDNYIGKTCTFRIDYIGTDIGKVLLTTDFSVTIKMAKIITVTNSTNSKPLYVKGCDCTILTALPLTIEIFTDYDCTVKYTGEPFKYTAPICLKVTSSSSLANQYYFDITGLSMAYDASGLIKSTSILTQAIITCGTKSACTKGVGTAAFDMLTVSSPVSFTVTVTLRDSSGQRLLSSPRFLQEVVAGNGLQGTTPPVKVTGIPSSAAGLTVTALSFLGLLLLLL